MNELWLLALAIATPPSLELYPQVVALARAPDPKAIHALMLRSVDRQQLIDRILIDAKDLGDADRARLGEAVLRNLELRASRSAGAVDCDREDAQESREGTERVLKIECRRGDGRATIELWIAEDGRIYDAALEGALLSRNLRAQINKGLRTHGLDEVIRRLAAG